MKAILKETGEKITITGIVEKNGKQYLSVKGWPKNTYTTCEYVTDTEGMPVTIDMIVRPQTNMQKMVSRIMEINNLSTHQCSGRILAKDAMEVISGIQIMAGGKGLTHLRNSSVVETNPSDFIALVADSVMKWGKCSEKQAAILAKYALDNNIE